jgi:hypothetical protein
MVSSTEVTVCKIERSTTGPASSPIESTNDANTGSSAFQIGAERWFISNSCHSGDDRMLASTTSARLPPCTMGQVCRKSPTQMTNFPPKERLLFIMSLHMSSTLKQPTLTRSARSQVVTIRGVEWLLELLGKLQRTRLRSSGALLRSYILYRGLAMCTLDRMISYAT